MKKFILTLVLTSIVFTPRAHALFGHVAAEKQKRDQAEQQLADVQKQVRNEEQKTYTWQCATSMLSAGCVACVVVGTAIGSRGRKHAK